MRERATYAAFLVCATAGCPKVVKPSSDSTPPSLTWNVYNHDTREHADHPGSPSLSAKQGERYRITLKAHDPEGVKSIQINPSIGSGEMSWTCFDPPGGENLAQNKNVTFAGSTQNLSPDSDGKVLTNIFLLFELDFTMSCPAGWTFGSGSAKLTGRATNYFAGATTSVITFSVAP